MDCQSKYRLIVTELEANVEGIQGHLWCETILEDYEMESMLCPRILGLSESAWSSQSNRRSGIELNDLVLKKPYYRYIYSSEQF